jgi:hypothetical protein
MFFNITLKKMNAIEHLQQLHSNVEINSKALGSDNIICRIIEILLPTINTSAELNDEQVKHLWEVLSELDRKTDVSSLSATMVGTWINSCR